MFSSTSELPQSEQPSNFSMCASPDFFNSITCSSLDPVGPLLLSLCCLTQGPYSLTPSTPTITWVRTAPRSTASAPIFLYHYAQDTTPGSLPFSPDQDQTPWNHPQSCQEGGKRLKENISGIFVFLFWLGEAGSSSLKLSQSLHSQDGCSLPLP